MLCYSIRKRCLGNLIHFHTLKRCWYNPEPQLPDSYSGIGDLINFFNWHFQDSEHCHQQTQSFADSFAAPIAYVSLDLKFELVDLQSTDATRVSFI